MNANGSAAAWPGSLWFEGHPGPHLGGGPGVDGHARHVAVADVRGRVTDHHVAARRQRADQLADQMVGLVLVLDQVQDRGQDDRDRAAEVERPDRSGQDRERLAQVGLDEVGSALGGADQQRAGVAQDDRVVVDVDDPGLRRDRLGDLVDVAAGRHAGADVEELTQAGLAGQVAGSAGQERPVGPGGGHHGRIDQHRLLGGFPVRGDGTPYMPYSTAGNRFGRMLDYLGISGVHTHSLRHQFASEALDASPRELANISQVLGHDSVETTLRFYIHASANAEQRIGAMMNARWTSKPAPAGNRA